MHTSIYLFSQWELDDNPVERCQMDSIMTLLDVNAKFYYYVFVKKEKKINMFKKKQVLGVKLEKRNRNNAKGASNLNLSEDV